MHRGCHKGCRGAGHLPRAVNALEGLRRGWGGGRGEGMPRTQSLWPLLPGGHRVPEMLQNTSGGGRGGYGRPVDRGTCGLSLAVCRGAGPHDGGAKRARGIAVLLRTVPEAFLGHFRYTRTPPQRAQRLQHRLHATRATPRQAVRDVISAPPGALWAPGRGRGRGRAGGGDMVDPDPSLHIAVHYGRGRVGAAGGGGRGSDWSAARRLQPLGPCA